ncbi:hypothetical protein ACNYS0_21170 [Streptomyces sp. BH034]|uniref:hypothetical protein n=1 Tax=Streptomyces sp. BH034 TaxID=3402626 RepID=UPI003BB78BF8
MISISATAHLNADTPIELKTFPNGMGGAFVSVEIGSRGGSGLGLLASEGQAEGLRRLAQVALEGAAELDRLAENGGDA